MTVYTLSDGGDIPTTMSGASAGDVIFLGTGTYTGNVTLTPGVTLAALHGATPVLTGELTTGATTVYSLVRGITFTATNHYPRAGRAWFEDCTFAAAAGTNNLLGDDAGRFFFNACTFTGATYIELLGAVHSFHGCYFADDFVTNDSPNSESYIIACTLRNTAAVLGTEIIWQVDTLLARDVVIQCATQATKAPFDVFTSGTIRHVVYDATSAVLDDQFNAVLTDNKAVQDVRLRDNGRLEHDSPARGAGSGANVAFFPYDRNRYQVGADAGCYMYHGSTSAMCAPWPLTDPAYGLNLTDVTRGAMLVTLNPQLFHDTRDIGSYIAQEVTRFFGQVDFTWGITTDNEIKLRKPFFDATGDVTTNNHAAQIFGIINETGVSTITLGANPRMLQTDLVWEAPTAPYIPAHVERFAFGQPDGLDLPDNSERRYCQFRMYTRTEDTTVARDVMNRWFSGSFLRVYRRWDETDPWSTTNDEGYDDVVPLPVDDGEYSWYTPNLTAYEINIMGLAKDRGL